MQTTTDVVKEKKRPGRKPGQTTKATKNLPARIPATKRLKVTDAVVVATPPTPLVEYIYKKKRIPKSNPPEYITVRKVGVLCSVVNSEGKVCIGFSVCHNTKDRFDYIRGIIHKPGHGLNVAKERAERWGTREYYEPIPGMFDFDFVGVVRVPPMIHKQLHEFINRCIRYYKGREIPKWAADFSRDFSLAVSIRE